MLNFVKDLEVNLLVDNWADMWQKNATIFLIAFFKEVNYKILNRWYVTPVQI